jgi:hypothetical protein
MDSKGNIAALVIAVKLFIYLGFEVFTTVVIKSIIFWDDAV